MAGTITSGWTTSFKKELAEAKHNFINAQHVFKVALLKSTSVIATNYGAASTSYDNLGTDEIDNGNGYTTGGIALTNISPSTGGTTSFWSWSNNPQWTAATFTTGGAVIYNDTAAGNPIVAVISFGGDKPLNNGTGTLTWPTNDATNAPMRLL